MLVRKIKCPACGAYKINRITTAYIYCDFCGTLMGYDVSMIQDEARELFSPEKMQQPAQQNYFKIAAELNQAVQAKDESYYLKLQLNMHEAEFDLYQKRFSPKLKQPAYRKKMLVFYEKYWSERLEHGFFEKQVQLQKQFAEVTAKPEKRYEHGRYTVEFDNNFTEFLDLIKRTAEESIEETMNMQALADYPDGSGVGTREIFYKQALASSILQYDEDTVKKSLEYLGIKSEFIDAEPVEMSDIKCAACSADLHVPAGAEHLLCEYCGTVNRVADNTIQCLACGGDFDPKTNDVCPYCSAHFLKVQNRNPETPETNAQKEEQKPKKKGFFGKWFS